MGDDLETCQQRSSSVRMTESHSPSLTGLFGLLSWNLHFRLRGHPQCPRHGLQHRLRGLGLAKAGLESANGRSVDRAGVQPHGPSVYIPNALPHVNAHCRKCQGSPMGQMACRCVAWVMSRVRVYE